MEGEFEPPKIMVQSQDSEDEELARRKRRRQRGLAGLPAVLVDVATVVVGALYHADCQYTKVTFRISSAIVD